MTSIAEAAERIVRGAAAANLNVEGVLDLSTRSGCRLPASLPENLTVDVLDLSGQPIESLPAGLTAIELRLANTLIREIPADVCVRSRLDLTGCDRLETLPAGLTMGTLILRGCSALQSLPEGLDVWFLDLTGCHAFETWPDRSTIRSGHLRLAGCTALRSLPSGLGPLSALSVRDCPNLTELPESLMVTGWIDVAHSGLQESSLPPGLGQTALRWAGVRVDHRIAFRPEEITVDEVLGEKNSERRRVLLDRYGYGRLLADAGAAVLDTDQDPGGTRQLLRISLPGDEDLVAMSCYCPSTGRQYVIRVPPATSTCRHAAAWIAGFDDPDDYQPLIET